MTKKFKKSKAKRRHGHSGHVNHGESCENHEMKKVVQEEEEKEEKEEEEEDDDDCCCCDDDDDDDDDDDESKPEGFEQSDEELEREHFASVVISMIGYGIMTQTWLDSMLLSPKTGVASLPRSHVAELRKHTAFFSRIDGLRTAVAANESFLRMALEPDWDTFAAEELPPAYGVGDTPDAVKCRDVIVREASRLNDENRSIALGGDYADRVRSTLAQIARDWSVDGIRERDACYAPMLAELEKRWPDVASRSKVSVLNPGSGLGRLTFEVAARGFVSQGNEFSMFMLLMSNFMLNRASAANGYTIYPYVRQNTNVRCAADQLRPVTFPDILPGDASSHPGVEQMSMSMTAGDFLEVYGTRSNVAAWDVLLTPFFIDTAHDIIQYLELFARIIKPGGVWINCGPLLWHFADIVGEQSLELTWEELRPLIALHGFDIIEERNIDCPYASNPRSLLSVAYHAIYFVAIRRGDTPIIDDSTDD